MRRKFLLIGGRREIKRVIHFCKNDRCREHNPFKVVMGELPNFRTDYSPPMVHISLDLGGPFLIKHACKLEKFPHPDYSKALLAKFCCNSTRYIQLSNQWKISQLVQ